MTDAAIHQTPPLAASDRSRGGGWLFAACATAILGLAMFAQPARAVHGDFLGETFGYNTLRKGELECELFPEIQVSPRQSVRGWYSGELGYGISSRLSFEGRGESVYRNGSPNLNGLQFAAVELGARYRFAEAGKWPVNVAVKLEYENERPAANGGEPEDNWTPTLSLSRDFSPRFSAVGNAGIKFRHFGPPAFEKKPTLPDSATFNYALGMIYTASQKLQLGLEFRDDPSFHIATLAPQGWLWLDKEVGVKLATGFGLTDTSDKFFARGSVEFEIDI